MLYSSIFTTLCSIFIYFTLQLFQHDFIYRCCTSSQSTFSGEEVSDPKPCQGLWILIMAKYLGGTVFLEAWKTSLRKVGKVAILGNKLATPTVSVGYWSLKIGYWGKGALSQDWSFFLGGKPLVFSICSGVELPLPKFSSCFQSSYKHPNIRKITKCKVVKALGMENKMGGCIY